jgi:hypothetical protein
MALTNPPLPDKGAGSIQDGSALRETVQAGKLPNGPPDKMWAGRSDGGPCAICGVPVELEEMEYELEYIRNDPDPGVDTHHVHIRCFTARTWNFQDPEVRRAVSSRPARVIASPGEAS